MVTAIIIGLIILASAISTSNQKIINKNLELMNKNIRFIARNIDRGD